MARRAKKPMYQVYHFRTNRQTAELLELAAKGHGSMSDFLREAAVDFARRLKRRAQREG